eukprot:Hpha_TRINITY_DN30834_c0_g1::TRINITY_DN30834_c0_g1_i1::g.155747::m.155747
MAAAAGDESFVVAPLVGMGLPFNLKGFPDDYENPRGLPRMEFYGENLDEFVPKKGGHEQLSRECQELYSRYKYFEAKFVQSKKSLSSKIPEIAKTIETLDHLHKKNEADEDIHTLYGLSDVVFAEATVRSRPERVGLWLGANVMVEYTIEEARALLQKNLATAKASLAEVSEDLAWIREQTAVCEVNHNRVHNWSVEQRRKKEAAAAK